MNIKTLKLVYFSPTGTTLKILEAIARGLAIDSIDHIDLTVPEEDDLELTAKEGDLFIIGAPVYGGRLPEVSIPRLEQLKGKGCPAVVIVLYGNREFEDALIELKDLVDSVGFIPVAGGAFIGEHSYSTITKPIAHGRPDKNDLLKAAEFGRNIMEKLTEFSSANEIPPIEVPGNHPYKKLGLVDKDPPFTDEEICIKCGTCADVCPLAIITIGDTVATDENKCIFCCACVKNCPADARILQGENIDKVADWLHNKCSERKEPETFLHKVSQDDIPDKPGPSCG